MPPRLHVMTATRNGLAVVLRRGPAKQVASLLWDRATGELSLGQWLCGRIHEHRSDLSPDGRHMIVFAGDGRRTWTAISRAPWLTALIWLPHGDHWFGGGAFTSDGRVFLNGGGALPDGVDGLRQAPLDAMPHGTDGIHMGGLYAAMLMRRGWRHVSGEGYGAVLDRKAGAGWRLELAFAQQRPDRALISAAHALVADDGRRLDMPGWEWADVWQDGLHVAEGGALHLVALGPAGIAGQRLMHDLAMMRFEARAAPYRGVS